MRQEGYVYVIDYGDGETFKIGHTIGEPVNRLQEIAKTPVIMPVKHRLELVMASMTCTDCRQLERLLHLLFENKRVAGEWFTLDFVNVVELYQALAVFGGVELYDRWYELIPTDYQKYIDGGAISPHLPWFSRKDYIVAAEEALKSFEVIQR